ncbi:MAG: hypothetical protein AAFW47_06605, partial [Pseudomonadota bacterium]
MRWLDPKANAKAWHRLFFSMRSQFIVLVGALSIGFAFLSMTFHAGTEIASARKKEMDGASAFAE